MDSIALAKELDREGIMKRFISSWRNMTGRKTQTDNIFIPTATLKLFKHLNITLPNHHLIFADFDSFIMPRKCVNGINAPLVTNKLAKPSDWQSFDSYLIPPGVADICFPSDFYFLRNAYELMTGKQAKYMKNMEMFDKYAVSNW
mmetsp:Transcript_4691/g.3949  ORF Transcript_4691/g.3949 Transcript_4691/m.3949 type:complete len:145 (-) Transcript_4691:73-507(-)